jgi:hypothetical protein
VALSLGVRKNRAVIAAGCAATLSLWGAQAAAQSFPTQGTPAAGIGSELVGRLNGATAERRFDGDVTLQAHYDSNVARGTAALATIRGVRKDDYVYEPSGKLNLTLPIAGQYVFLEGSAGYDFYQYNKLLQRERIDMIAGLTSGFGPCQAALQGAYSRHQSDLADLTATVTKNTAQETSIGVQGECQTGSSIGETLSYQHGQSNNSAPTGSGVVNSDVDAVSAGVQYGSKTLGSFGASVSYSKVNYGNSATLTPTLPAPTGFETTSGQLTFQRPIGNRLVGMASLGYSKASATGVTVVPGAPVAAPTSGFGGVTGVGSLSYDATTRLHLTLTYQRSVTPTIQDGSNFAIQQSVGLDARYKLSTRLQASLGARWSDRSFRDQPVLTPTLIVNDRQRSIYGSIQMKVGRNASLTLDAREDVRNTNLTFFNYTAYRVGVTASQSF